MEEFYTKLTSSGASRPWILHFFSHSTPLPPSPPPSLLAERQSCHYCQLTSFSTHAKYPISILNDVPGDTSTLPSSFRFIESNLISPGVEFADESFKSGCECTEGEMCKKETCGCLQDLEEPPEEAMGDWNPYDEEGCLKEWMLESRRPIYECHELCKCDPETCPNRVVGKGRKIGLQVFRTGDGRGWGLRPSSDLKKGQFLSPYTGDLLTPSLATHRRHLSHSLQKRDIYLFALDKFTDPHSPDPSLRLDPYEIDGEYNSGPTRFINHSCDPNLRVFAVVRDHADKGVHGLCFFALRDVVAGEELTFDYVDGVDGVKGQGEGEGMRRKGRPRKADGLQHRGTGAADMKQTGTPCLCGAKSCRGFLW